MSFVWIALSTGCAVIAGCSLYNGASMPRRFRPRWWKAAAGWSLLTVVFMALAAHR